MSTIQLGAPGALRKYLVKARGDGLMWGRGPAQPFSAKVNSSNKYDQVDIWNEWVQEDWQAGVGRVNPEEGGFLYGEIDSRVPNQLILPTAIGHAHYRPFTPNTSYFGHLPADAADYDQYTISVGTDEAMAARIKYDHNGAGTHNVAFLAIAFFGFLSVNVGLTFSLYAGNATLPSGAALASQALTVNQDAPLRPTWYGVALATPYTATPTGDMYYWGAVQVGSGSVFTLLGASSNANSATATLTPPDWSGNTEFFPFFHVATGVVLT